MREDRPIIDVKIEYCRNCGSCLDSNRRCTGCGKQYFHIKKGFLLKLYAVVVTLALVTAVYKNNWNVKNTYDWINLYNAAQGQIDEINTALEDSHISQETIFCRTEMVYSFSQDQWIENSVSIYDNLTVPDIVKTLTSSYFKHKDKLSVLEKDNKHLKSDLDYLSAHTAFVTETGAKYHKYNCYHLSNSKGFWIYNVEAAKSKGYTACSDCW